MRTRHSKVRSTEITTFFFFFCQPHWYVIATYSSIHSEKNNMHIKCQINFSYKSIFLTYFILDSLFLVQWTLSTLEWHTKINTTNYINFSTDYTQNYIYLRIDNEKINFLTSPPPATHQPLFYFPFRFRLIQLLRWIAIASASAHQTFPFLVNTIIKEFVYIHLFLPKKDFPFSSFIGDPDDDDNDDMT